MCIELIPTWLCIAELQCVDGFREFPGAPVAAAELGEDLPCFELRVCPFAAGAEFAWARLASFCGSGLFRPLYGTFAQVLP
jgi:hypothetical protein